MEVKDALTLMIGFSSLLVAPLSLVMTIVIALIQSKKK
ncbi:putative holin-like toxin [Paenibacillus sp. P26]|nr:putative holin-like toxin [Paenibacillus sp. P26]UUZ93136.1 putative holin-like toxin [Paenibacillus sp. P25]